MTRKRSLIISDDHVFTTLLYRLLNNSRIDFQIEKYSSFSAIRSIETKDVIDLIFIDNSITGAANHEIISFIRLTKKIIAPLYYFSNSEKDERIAFQRGANTFTKKPFSPNALMEQISNTISD